MEGRGKARSEETDRGNNGKLSLRVQSNEKESLNLEGKNTSKDDAWGECGKNNFLVVHSKGFNLSLGEVVEDLESLALIPFGNKIKVDEKDLKKAKRESLSRT